MRVQIGGTARCRFRTLITLREPPAIWTSAASQLVERATPQVGQLCGSPQARCAHVRRVHPRTRRVARAIAAVAAGDRQLELFQAAVNSAGRLESVVASRAKSRAALGAGGTTADPVPCRHPASRARRRLMPAWQRKRTAVRRRWDLAGISRGRREKWALDRDFQGATVPAGALLASPSASCAGLAAVAQHPGMAGIGASRVARIRAVVVLPAP
jgi:hypothetical protein